MALHMKAKGQFGGACAHLILGTLFLVFETQQKYENRYWLSGFNYGLLFGSTWMIL
jgi:hypothetical protein